MDMWFRSMFLHEIIEISYRLAPLGGTHKEILTFVIILHRGIQQFQVGSAFDSSLIELALTSEPIETIVNWTTETMGWAVKFLWTNLGSSVSSSQAYEKLILWYDVGLFFTLAFWVALCCGFYSNSGFEMVFPHVCVCVISGSSDICYEWPLFPLESKRRTWTNILT